MERINIEEILQTYSWYLDLPKWKEQQVKAAIKEIVEAVMDRCAEVAGITYIAIDNGSDEGGTQVGVNKKTILEVKQMLDYE